MDHQQNHLRLRELANSGQMRKASELALRWHRQYPQDILYAYARAVFYGDDGEGRDRAELRKRYKTSAQLLKPLLRRLRGLAPRQRSAIRNEYYWFSGQPLKQYRLGVEGVRRGENRAHYSRGVGAVEVARKYFLLKREKMALRWAVIAEKAWLQFFKHDRNWYNSYCFYSMALGFQGRMEEMERALKKAAQISGKSLHCDEFNRARAKVKEALKRLHKEGVASC